MTTPPLPLWKTEAADASFSDPAACAARTTSFERTIRVRNIVEYIAGGFVTVLFGASSIAALVKGEYLVGGALTLTLLGIFVVMWNLYQRAGNLDRRAEDPCLIHLRRQYERQHTFLRNVPRWYLGPLVPGIIMLYAAIAYEVAQVSTWAIALDGIKWPLAYSVGLFALIAAANWFAARSIKRKIDTIDALA